MESQNSDSENDALADLNRNQHKINNECLSLSIHSPKKDTGEASDDLDRASKTSNEDTETGSHSGIADRDPGLVSETNGEGFFKFSFCYILSHREQ